MTIRLPGIAEQLAPSMEGIGSFLKNIANPNYDQQAALREALLAGRIQYDDLAKMSDEDVERQFGRGTAVLKPKDRQPTMKDMVDRFGAQEVGRRMSLPDGDPQKEELRAGITPGGMRPNQRTLEQQGVDKGKADLDEIKRQTDSILLHSNVVKRLEGQGLGKNIYADYKAGAITPQEKSQLMANKDFRDRWDRESSEYWNQTMEKYRRDALDEKNDPKKLTIQFNRMIAERYAERANNSGILTDVNDVVSVIENPQLMKLWGDVKETPTDPAAAKIWSAVQAVKKSMSTEGDADRKKALTAAHELFRRNTQGILSTLSSEQNRAKAGGETEVAALVQRVNSEAQKAYGGVLPPNEIPTFAFDKQHPSIGKGVIWNDKVFYQKSGNSEASLIPDGTIPVVEGGAPAPTSPMASAAAKAIKENRIGEALSTAPTAEIRKQLAEAIAAAGGDTTTVAKKDSAVTKTDTVKAAPVSTPSSSRSSSSSSSGLSSFKINANPFEAASTPTSKKAATKILPNDSIERNAAIGKYVSKALSSNTLPELPEDADERKAVLNEIVKSTEQDRSKYSRAYADAKAALYRLNQSR
jgi:hypothetical protein